MRHRPLTSVVLAAALAVGSTACGSDDDGAADVTTTLAADSSSTATGADTSAPDSTTTPEPAADQTAPASINGITSQGDTLWIASIGEDQVLRVDRSSGAILTRYDTQGAGPDDVAVAPDGTIWVTGYESGVLGRIVDGEYQEVVTLAPLINGVDVAEDGSVYVASLEADGKLWRVPADGGEPEVVATGLVMVNAFEIDESDGTILGPSDPMGSPAIVRIDPADGTIERVVEGLPAVLASTWHPDGRFVALANITGDVLAVDVDAGTFEVIATVPDGAPFDNLTYADDGTLYISSFVAPTVTEVKPDGTVRVIPVGTPVPSGG